jgi:hypothetical protein
MASINSDTITFGDGTSIQSYLTNYAIGTHIVAAVASTYPGGYGNYEMIGGSQALISGSNLYVENGVYVDSRQPSWYIAAGNPASDPLDFMYWCAVRESILTNCPMRFVPGNVGWQSPIGAVTTLSGTWAVLSRCVGSRSFYNSISNYTQTLYPTALLRRVA